MCFVKAVCFDHTDFYVIIIFYAFGGEMLYQMHGINLIRWKFLRLVYAFSIYNIRRNDAASNELDIPGLNRYNETYSRPE